MFTRERVLTLALALATLVALYLCYRIVQPFIPPIAFALALCIATLRPYRWLKRYLKTDIATAAASVVLVTLLIIGPAAFLTTYLVQQGIENINELREGDGIANLRTTLENNPRFGGVFRWAQERFDLQTQLASLGQALASHATGILTGSVAIITQLVVTLFVLFFLYRDREPALQALRALVPLSHGEADRMFSRVGSTIMATVNGSLTVAFVQAVLAAVMYLLLGVPGAALWGTVTFIMALIPVFGTFIVWGPIACYLALTGSLVKAAILVGWGILAVGSIDNVLYPFLVGDKLRLHTVPTFFSILGGIGLFGAAGLILGPMALAITIGLLDIWWCRTEAGQAAEEAVVERPVTEAPPPGDVLQHASPEG